MPVFLLVGVLVVSVAANALLLLWLSQAEHVTLHWPRSMQDGLVFSRADRPSGRAAATGRRSLFIAGDPATSAASAERQARARVPVQSDRPIADTLPPSLADLLSGTAPLSPAPSSIAPGQSGEPDVPRGPRAALVRLAAAGGQASLAIDALTGVENAEGWSRIMEIENARLLRYRRPSTVVLAEIDGLRRLADEVGEDPALRLLPVVADAFRREARSSDWVARIGYGRFAAFLAETDEILAINYVERIRQLCEPWLASAAIPLRLAIGWSSATASSDLEFALKRAEERMHSDRRMPGKYTAQRMMPARVVALPRNQPPESDAVSQAETENADQIPWDGPQGSGEPSKGANQGPGNGKAAPKPSRTPADGGNSH